MEKGECSFMALKEEDTNTADSTIDNATVQLQRERNNITIGDVAEALGVSKTTVSRAISGKGRIGAETTKRVLDYIKENHYRPNVVAKGLAKSKTYNIGWVMPGDSNVSDLPFFQRCMMGISEVAASGDYDILISMVFDRDISQLKSIVKNRKVDGIILGRTLVEDEGIKFLKKSDMPFVVIGSSVDDGVIQIDNDHVKACKELTAIVIMKGVRRLALIGGSTNHVVNLTRREGFEMGLMEQGIPVNQDLIYMDCETDSAVERAVDNCLRNRAECIITTDDRICHSVLEKLGRDGVRIPDQLKVASFYSSIMLENNQPAITSLHYDPKELGIVACKTLFDYLAGKEVQKKVLLGYEVVLKGSTQ
jgi:DNA-binding LacI/PurR family transcriptional regulator